MSRGFTEEMARLAFRQKYVVDEETGCWNWIGAASPNGYGIYRYQGRNRPAHRISWEWSNGREMEKGLYACHSCDNKKCVNPDHLTEGTPSDNVRAAWKSRDRGKKALPKPEYPKKTWHEAHEYRMKLTAEQVQEMRRRREAERISFGKLAKEYGVSETAARFAVQGKRWSHLEEI